MGMGSNTTPTWVDEEIIDRKKKKRIDLENSTIIKNLRTENESLKKRIKQLEDKLKRINK
jgi:hypothetical protein